MHNWDEFGKQINRLVYALAGRKFETDIESANRFIAERIFYSEVSVRLMRQGRFLPREEKALETLVEIGISEAELGQDWASQLLRGGKHSNPAIVMQKQFPTNMETPHLQSAIPESQLFFAIRLSGGVIGSFLIAIVWTYLLNPAYPAPHELPLLIEISWGFLVGVGLDIGVLIADQWMNDKIMGQTRWDWSKYLVLPASGMIGAIIWNGLFQKLFSSSPLHSISSTGLESFCYGFTYALSFALGMFLINLNRLNIQEKGKYLKLSLLLVLICGALSWLGYILAVIKPAFDNQKEIDLFVGILLRIGLILMVGLLLTKTKLR